MTRWTPRNVVVVLVVASLCAALPASIMWRGAHVRSAQAQDDRLHVCEIERDAAEADVASVEAVWPGLLKRCKESRKADNVDHQEQVNTLTHRINWCWPSECQAKLVDCRNGMKSEEAWYQKRLRLCGCN